mmetsp:Transcript_5336/g.7468  ORF Transcript_5336/g.7468 Transcript_5336/m.7468 type:complete len:210 (-) Transcript_5336:11-640(-)
MPPAKGGRGGGYQDSGDGKGRRKGGKGRGNDTWEHGEDFCTKQECEDGGETSGKGGRGKSRRGDGQKDWGSSQQSGTQRNSNWRGNSGGGNDAQYGSYSGLADAQGAYAAENPYGQFWGWQPMTQQVVSAPLWTEYAADDGTPYYYNARTGLTQWQKPEELLKQSENEVQRTSEGADPSAGGHGRGAGKGGDDGKRDDGGAWGIVLRES